MEIGKAGFLPSISENFSFYRQTAINQLEKKQYTNAATSLNNLNSCLGEDYLVTISTALYEQAVKDNSVYQCNNCTMPFKKIINKGEENESTKEIDIPSEILTTNVRIFDRRISILESVIVGGNTIKVWICPECNEENEIDTTKKIIPQTVNPYFLKVVWDNPVQQNGISNRLGFDFAFHEWFDTFLKEINWQEVLYRKEYKSQNGFDMEESDYKDRGDKK